MRSGAAPRGPLTSPPLNTRDGVEGHGTEISASAVEGVNMTAEEAREIIGTRFLADPNFSVVIDGARVTFDDVSPQRLKEVDVAVPPYGTAHLTIVDTLKAERTTRQHGIAWRVNNRLVGTPSWIAFDQERVLDGRKTEAKRYQIIVEADFLEDSVLHDWTAFIPESESWLATRAAVHEAIQEYLSASAAERRQEAKESVRENLSDSVSKLSPMGRSHWNEFVDKVVDSCPSISTDEVQQVASILANLELSKSKYGLVQRLHQMKPGDLDELNQILVDWNVKSAKIALDEIQSRLKLIEELDLKLRDKNSDEVGDLQPLFDRSLWVFGPEFESLEFTSNKGMTEVIRSIFGSNVKGSRLRPDFVMLPDGSAGFYSRDLYDAGHEVSGVARLVVAEIKKPGVPIGSTQKDQAWKYVIELIKKGFVTKATNVTCFVLGSTLDETDGGERKEWEDRVIIRPMSYSTFIQRASARMLGLRDKLKDTPFLKEQGIEGAAFLEPPIPRQSKFNLRDQVRA